MHDTDAMRQVTSFVGIESFVRMRSFLIVYGGFNWRRYPDRTDDRSSRLYFRSIKKNGKNTSISLNRQIYEDFIGEIPSGMFVVFKDGDCDNNHPDNLELSSVEQIIANARSGLKNYVRNRGVKSCVCLECGKTFKSTGHPTVVPRHCSKKCRSKTEYKNKQDMVDCECSVCGTIFRRLKKTPRKTCSSECRSKQTSIERREWHARQKNNR